MWWITNKSKIYSTKYKYGSSVAGAHAFRIIKRQSGIGLCDTVGYSGVIARCSFCFVLDGVPVRALIICTVFLFCLLLDSSTSSVVVFTGIVAP